LGNSTTTAARPWRLPASCRTYDGWGLRGDGITDAGVAVLVESPAGRDLEELVVEGPDLNTPGYDTLRVDRARLLDWASRPGRNGKHSPGGDAPTA
jgi:hypothetical protein